MKILAIVKVANSLVIMFKFAHFHQHCGSEVVPLKWWTYNRLACRHCSTMRYGGWGLND